MPVEQCDVQDKNTLRKYRDFRARWLEWIQADPNHSIWSQIFAMINNDLAVHTIACAAENDLQSPLHNPLLAATILEGHRDAQILGIRRLWNKGGDVISLRRLLKEIRAHVNLFTREIYISGSGLPYDPPSAVSIATVTGPGYVSGDSLVVGQLRAEKAQQRFDRLSRVPPNRRARTDRIVKSLIDRLEAHITDSGADEAVKWSHQFVAHAGDSQAIGWRNLQVTFEQVAAVQKSVVQVVHLVSAYLLEGPSLGLLVPITATPFDRFDRLVNPQALAIARQRREELEKERNSWLHNDFGSPDLLTVVGWPDCSGP
jgi:hypothetical protein